MITILKSMALFVLAGLFEIGGGYMVWLSLREGKPWWIGVLGGLILIGYGVVATWQPANFGRVYAAYGGIFIVMAIIWGWKVDGVVPDKYDLIGGAVALLGVLIIMYAPRST
jgi:small multidrug resistance family-3 protein